MTEYPFWVHYSLNKSFDGEKCHGDITDQSQRTLLQLVLPFDLDLGDGHIFVLENRRQQKKGLKSHSVFKGIWVLTDTQGCNYLFS